MNKNYRGEHSEYVRGGLPSVLHSFEKIFIFMRYLKIKRFLDLKLVKFCRFVESFKMLNIFSLLARKASLEFGILECIQLIV